MTFQGPLQPDLSYDPISYSLHLFLGRSKECKHRCTPGLQVFLQQLTLPQRLKVATQIVLTHRGASSVPLVTCTKENQRQVI